MTCMICFLQPDSLDQVQLFRECRHAFCKDCVRQHVEHVIKEGQIDRLVCPATDELTSKPCTCTISELDLKAVGTDEELIAKVTVFSIN